MKIEYLADRPELVATLAAWHRREWGQFRPEESVEMRADKLRGWSGRGEIPMVLVASDGDTLLGSAVLLACDMDSRKEWSPWLAGVVVGPEFRRRGIGAALAARVVEEARALGHAKLYLYTFSTERYYARLGWQFIEHSRYLGAEVTVMSLDLPTNPPPRVSKKL